MPQCFQLSRKSNPTAGAVALNSIDVELCELLGLPVHPRLYVGGWFDYIGFALATGKSFADIRQQIAADIARDDFKPAIRADDSPELTAARAEFWANMSKMVEYLDANFSPDCWAEIGKRR